MNEVVFIDWGLIDYKRGWDKQEQLFNETVSIKIANRNLLETEQKKTKSYLVFCEHPHVFTLGKSGAEKHLLVSDEQLEELHATYYKINRGGDITYHGPGQIVGYPLLDLDLFFTDIHKYLRFLEEMIILTLKDYGIEAGRYEGYTGVWLDGDNPAKARKICAMGVRCSRWVTMHGFAFNVNTDLSYFKNIVACGIEDRAVTSLEKELGRAVDMEEVKEKLRVNFAKLFDCRFSFEKELTR